MGAFPGMNTAPLYYKSMPLDDFTLNILLELASKYQNMVGDLQRTRTFLEEYLAKNNKSEAEVKEFTDAVMKRIEDKIKSLSEDGPPMPIRESFDGWYTGPGSSSPLWNRYKKTLEAKRWTKELIDQMDRSTTTIVGMMAPPGVPKFNYKGLAVGRVQSGKTGNFIGVLAKAADAGYRMVIVLGGTTNTLRYQTQDRIQKDLISIDDPSWTWLTSAICRPGSLEIMPGDFGQVSPAAGEAVMASQKSIGVIKKNAVILRNLKAWVSATSAQAKSQCPVLIIDDECDQASVNSADPDSNPTTINRLIREIIGMLPKVTYIGYTATPFANVFIDPEVEGDLYPKDFIVSLPKSEFYFGPERIFGRDPITGETTGQPGANILREISDPDVECVRPPSGTAAAQAFRFEIPPTLSKAIVYFILNSAARIWREKNVLNEPGNGEFKSMLINTSQKQRIHSMTMEKVQPFVSQLKSDFAAGKTEASWSKLWMEETEKLNSDEVGCKHPKVTYDQLKQHLQETLNRIEVIKSNSSGEQVSNLNEIYHTNNRGKIVIVIGGNTLSRGITLEGLTVSYFVREAGAFDTLLQMGRWFGYRKDYEDMPRVWMTAQMMMDFFDLATIEFEFFKILEPYVLGLSPREVGPKIRQHPDYLPTAKSKMRRAIECNISYTGHLIETTYFPREDTSWLKANLDAGRKLVATLGGASAFTDNGRSSFVKTGVSLEDVIGFLKHYKVNERNKRFSQSNVISYLETALKDKHHLNWNVVLRSNSRQRPEDGVTDIGIPLNNLNIAPVEAYPDKDIAYIKSLRSPTDVICDATLTQAAGAPKARREDELMTFRNSYAPSTGLLILYPLNKDAQGNKQDRKDMKSAENILGCAIYFAQGEGSPHSYLKVQQQCDEPPEEPSDEDEITPNAPQA
jgi:hypothetical protein